jgi:glycosyltransferase involved in cell wall biosynthesis
MQSRHVLALEPFYGGSHQAFLDGWSANSCHNFTVLGLPPYKWKWRMRHSAVTFSHQLGTPPYNDQAFEVLWCSDMLNLAEFLGLAPDRIRKLPRIVYFHENQLTYPVRVEQERDLHFAYSNFTTCLAADQVWFNSAFHQHEFTQALTHYLGRMPDFQSSDLVETIAAKATVQHPGIVDVPKMKKREPGPLRIVWNARWEHDKNPDDFFAAMRKLKSVEFPFELLVLGESFGNVPQIFATAREEFAEHILHWGYVDHIDQYRQLLTQGDIVVSTAQHEFFGIGIVEAMAAGATPMVPDRLSYPEVLSRCPLPIDPSQLIYGQTPDELSAAIHALAPLLAGSDIRQNMADAVSSFSWRTRADPMDCQINSATLTGSNAGNGTRQEFR